MRYIWLIPLLPGIGAAINGLLGIRYFSRKTAGVIACTMMIAALGLSVAAFWQMLGLPADARGIDVVVAQWIPSIPLATSKDRKSTRLNSSHITISYAVFCLKKKKQQQSHNQSK